MARSSGRLGRLLKASVESLLAPAEDPRTAYADPAEQQQALLDQLRHARRRLAASRLRLDKRRTEAEQQVRSFDEPAKHALLAGRDDLARLALHRQRIVRQEVTQLSGQIDALEREETQLLVADQRLAAQVEALRSREQIAEARRTAAEAQVAVGEVLSGVGGAVGDLQLIERIERDAEELEARADAIEGLINAGLLSATGGAPGHATDLDDEIESRLAALRAELSRQKPERTA